MHTLTLAERGGKTDACALGMFIHDLTECECITHISALVTVHARVLCGIDSITDVWCSLQCSQTRFELLCGITDVRPLHKVQILDLSLCLALTDSYL